MASLYDDFRSDADIILTLNNQFVGRKIIALDTTLVTDKFKLENKKFNSRRGLPSSWTNLNYTLDDTAIDAHGKVSKIPRLFKRFNPLKSSKKPTF
jgi:hypothetical protein